MAALRDARIRHSVFLRLVHPAGSEAEAAFLGAIAALRTIEGVEEFESTREVSPKNGYRFGLTMQFAEIDTVAL